MLAMEQQIKAIRRPSQARRARPLGRGQGRQGGDKDGAGGKKG
jgi:hypothetical protein